MEMCQYRFLNLVKKDLEMFKQLTTEFRVKSCNKLTVPEMLNNNAMEMCSNLL